MKSIKKLLILLFVTVMLCSAFATVALATDGGNVPEGNNSQQENATFSAEDIKSFYFNESNELVLVKNDDSEINTGVRKTGAQIYRDEDHQLIVELEDGTKLNLGVKPEIVDTDADISINPNKDRFVDSLQYMWKGMLCIFIVIGVIILSIYGLNAASNAIAAKKSAKAEDSEN